MPGEKDYLNRLSAVDCLHQKRPVVDGAALVFRVHHDSTLAEFVVEVRLPKHDSEGHKCDGKLFAFLQNLTDNPIQVSAPEFMLTGGLFLPWTIGISLMANEYRGEWGEVLTWETPLTGSEDVELLGAEIGRILEICRDII